MRSSSALNPGGAAMLNPGGAAALDAAVLNPGSAAALAAALVAGGSGKALCPPRPHSCGYFAFQHGLHCWSLAALLRLLESCPLHFKFSQRPSADVLALQFGSPHSPLHVQRLPYFLQVRHSHMLSMLMSMIQCWVRSCVAVAMKVLAFLNLLDVNDPAMGAQLCG